MRREGFTLPETIVAMSLFAMAATVLCQAALNANLALMRLEHKEDAHLKMDWVREEILSITDRAVIEEGGELVFPLHVRKKPLDDEEPEPEDGISSIKASWEAEIFPTHVLDVHRLDITVTIELGEELAEPRTASYYVYRPDWYEETDGRGSLMSEKEADWERQQLLRGI
ncbi:type II secretion system protein [Pontiellaceae bacterium B12219]|nr:type II secretion system protein [Pontiellaceae bacterium B12219]